MPDEVFSGDVECDTITGNGTQAAASRGGCESIDTERRGGVFLHDQSVLHLGRKRPSIQTSDGG